VTRKSQHKGDDKVLHEATRPCSSVDIHSFNFFLG
jgi:hypothetical protein